jgi:hypothetical protein
MAATPRLGDGYRTGYDPGAVEAQVEVLSLDESLQLRGGDFEEVLVLEETSPLEPGVVVVRYYARGIGLVFQETVSGGDEEAELVRVTGA